MLHPSREQPVERPPHRRNRHDLHPDVQLHVVRVLPWPWRSQETERFDAHLGDERIIVQQTQKWGRAERDTLRQFVGVVGHAEGVEKGLEPVVQVAASRDDFPGWLTPKKTKGQSAPGFSNVRDERGQTGCRAPGGGIAKPPEHPRWAVGR
jgi:hypothetical protein